MEPKTWEQLAILLIALLPGFVFQVTYSRLLGSGAAEKPISARVFSLVGITLAFDAAYVWIFGAILESLWSEQRTPVEVARVGSLVAIVLIFVIPGIVALFSRYVAVAVRRRSLRVPLSNIFRGTSYATSWDYAAEASFGDVVRIQYEDGSYIGGYVGGSAHMSTSPAPKDMFISNLRILDEHGYFATVSESTDKHPYGGSGVWVNCDKARTVEFLRREVCRDAGRGEKG